MASLSGMYDPKDQPQEDNFSVLPAGDYTVMITASDVKDIKSGKGKCISLEMDIIDGKYKGRKIFENLCTIHESEQVQAIARGKFASLKKSLGVRDDVSDTTQLHNIRVVANVRVKDSKKNPGEKENEIKSYKSIAEAKQPKPAQSDAAPWKRTETENVPF